MSIASISFFFVSSFSTTVSGWSKCELETFSIFTSLPASVYSSKDIRFDDFICPCQSLNSSIDMPISAASSSSVATFPLSDSIFAIAASIFFCFCLSERGIQSIFLIWSSIAPLILRLAYVSNLTFLPKSNLSIASISPNTPYPTRSSYSTLYPRYIFILPATSFTSCAY